MKKLLLILVLFVVSNSAMAEWTYYESEKAREGKYYPTLKVYQVPEAKVDRYLGIPKTGYAKHIVTVEVLDDHADARDINKSGIGGKLKTYKYYSSVRINTVDCLAGKFARGKLRWMSERMGKGKPVITSRGSPQEWKPVYSFDKTFIQARDKCAENGYPLTPAQIAEAQDMAK